MQYIACISYGKDSLAMLEVIHQNNMPLDRICHIELMATDTISADLPETTAWKRCADDIIHKRYGIQVEHIRPKESYETLFYAIPERKPKNKHMQGMIRGFPALRSQWCMQMMKAKTMWNLIDKRTTVQYIGIAIDEPLRHAQLNYNLRSPLVEHSVTEAEAMEICERLNLVAPLYLQSKRSGCWFCHAQPINQLRLLRKQHPDLWEILLGWDKDSPIPFRHDRSGKQTVHDFERRFKLEDKGVLSANDYTFKWARMDEYERQTTF